MLHDATDQLKLGWAARRVFMATNGTEIMSAAQLTVGLECVVSNGEEFVPRVSQQTSRGTLNTSRHPNSSRKAHNVRPQAAGRPRVVLFPNDGGRIEEGVCVLVHGLGELLDLATDKLQMRWAARKLFNTDGGELKEFVQILPGMHIIASMGEPFKIREGQPVVPPASALLQTAIGVSFVNPLFSSDGPSMGRSTSPPPMTARSTKSTRSNDGRPRKASSGPQNYDWDNQQWDSQYQKSTIKMRVRPI